MYHYHFFDITNYCTVNTAYLALSFDVVTVSVLPAEAQLALYHQAVLLCEAACAVYDLLLAHPDDLDHLATFNDNVVRGRRFEWLLLLLLVCRWCWLWGRDGQRRWCCGGGWRWLRWWWVVFTLDRS